MIVPRVPVRRVHQKRRHRAAASELTKTLVNPGDLACDATKGYEGPTGVGTPNGLAAFAKTGAVGPIFSTTTVLTFGLSHTWKISAVDPFPGGKITGYVWNFGDGSKTVSTTANTAAHKYAKAGKYTITVTTTDSYKQTGTSTTIVKIT